MVSIPQNKQNDQAKRLADIYVRCVPPDDARLQKLAPALMEPLVDSIREAFESGLPVPYFELSAGKSPLTVTHDQGRPTFHIGADAPELHKECVNAFRRYLVERETLDNGNEAIGPSVGKIENSGEEDHTTGQHGYSSLFSMADGPDQQKEVKNTGTDLKFYKKLRESSNPVERQEWKFWLDHLFEDKQLERFDHRDWLRMLRVLNGISTTEMGAYLGIGQSAYSNFENRRHFIRREGKETYTFKQYYCQQCLNKNIFNLPVEPSNTQVVQKEFAHKFLAKFGHEPVFVHETYMPQLAAALKASAVAYYASADEPVEHISPPTVGNQLTAGRMGWGGNRLKLGDWQTYRKAHDIPPSSDYLFAAPVHNPGQYLHRKSNPLPDELVRRQVFIMLEAAGDLPTFLRHYSKKSGMLLDEVNVRQGCSRMAVLGWHNGTLMRRSAFERMIASNSYDFPTGDDGKIHPEIVDGLNKLYNGQRYHNPFIPVEEALREFGIARIEEVEYPAQPSWQRKVQYQPTDEREAFGAYWEGLEKSYKKTGKITIAGQPVRCWLDGFEQLCVHKDDLTMLANDPRWHTLRHEYEQAGSKAAAKG